MSRDEVTVNEKQSAETVRYPGAPGGVCVGVGVGLLGAPGVVGGEVGSVDGPPAGDFGGMLGDGLSGGGVGDAVGDGLEAGCVGEGAP